MSKTLEAVQSLAMQTLAWDQHKIHRSREKDLREAMQTMGINVDKYLLSLSDDVGSSSRKPSSPKTKSLASTTSSPSSQPHVSSRLNSNDTTNTMFAASNLDKGLMHVFQHMQQSPYKIDNDVEYQDHQPSSIVSEPVCANTDLKLQDGTHSVVASTALHHHAQSKPTSFYEFWNSAVHNSLNELNQLNQQHHLLITTKNMMAKDKHFAQEDINRINTELNRLAQEQLQAKQKLNALLKQKRSFFRSRTEKLQQCLSNFPNVKSEVLEDIIRQNVRQIEPVIPSNTTHDHDNVNEKEIFGNEGDKPRQVLESDNHQQHLYSLDPL